MYMLMDMLRSMGMVIFMEMRMYLRKQMRMILWMVRGITRGERKPFLHERASPLSLQKDAIKIETIERV